MEEKQRNFIEFVDKISKREYNRSVCAEKVNRSSRIAFQYYLTLLLAWAYAYS